MTFTFRSLPKYSIFVFLCFLISNTVQAQTTIFGTVTEKNGSPILGANVYLEGTYDGATTTTDGSYSFTTNEKGQQTLIVSFMSFETFRVTDNVTAFSNYKVVLKEDVNSLNTVVISAGSFEANDNSKVSVLKPLDVVTTASALGDFVGALQTLPGTTTVAEDGRLFVRGGDANETQIFIDGLRVFSPYTPTTANTPTRGRYSPFLFDGITFSTGGYSAEYGQALSSVLLLNTIDEPDQEKTEISVMSVGAGLGNTQKWENASLSVNASYMNLAPYLALLPDRNEWQKPFETLAGETVYRQKIGKGKLKAYAAFDTTNFNLVLDDINFKEGVDFGLKNNNFYSNLSFQTPLANKWKLETGGSFTYSNNKTDYDTAVIDSDEKSVHVKAKLRKRFNSKFKLSFGAEQFLTDYSERYDAPFETYKMEYDTAITGVFTEADYIFSKKIAAKVGMRGSYSQLFKEFTIAPRISFAYKTGKNSQLSVAYGDFYQQPQSEYLKYTQDLESARAQHFIANYQYTANNRIFRAELFRKSYHHLITFTGEMAAYDSAYGTDGDGYAQGLDVFFRDNETLKSFEYWLSYSYLDSERTYLNYPTAATPNFANTHNISVVGKYFIKDWKSQVGFSFQHGSGRSYTNPNVEGFLNQKTKGYNNLSLNWAYLLSQQQILYFSINNVTNFKNVNGYQYADSPNAMGNFDRSTLRPSADQFFFVGFFWTISDDGTDNQLDKL
ncbi:probable outer membrane receptor protein [unidentified eubacterium SCB49]|nr:probable outer membrane receptor protein [unidentified eubacterium SCB49]